MRKHLIAITAGMLLLASAVTVSAESAAKAKKGPGGPDPTCTQSQTTSGPEQEKEQPESKTQDVENQQGTQEGQTGDTEGNKEVKDDSSAEADQPQQNSAPKSAKPGDSNLQEDDQCGDQSAGKSHGQTLKKGHDTTPSGAADSNRNDD